MSSAELPTPPFKSNRRRQLITVAATLVVLATFGVAASLSRWTNVERHGPALQAPPIAETGRIPPIPPGFRRTLPPVPLELPPEPQLEIVVDVDRNGNLHVDGKRMELAALRELLAMRQVEAGSVGVTIRADERCRFFHVRQVIRACDETAGVPYKLRPLPEENDTRSS